MSENEIWNELGNLYFSTGAYHEAIRLYQKAIALDHCTSQSYNNLASIYVHQENYPEAIRMLQRGIETLRDARERAMLWNQLGEIYRKLDDYENASASYRKAAELDPGNTAFQDNLAEVELVNQPEDTETISEPEQETETVPEMLSALLDTINNSAPESPTWVFNQDEPERPAQANAMIPPEAAPVILGSRLLANELTEVTLAEPEPEPEEQVSPETNLRMQGLLWLGIQLRDKGEPERALRFVKIAVDEVARPKDPTLEALCYNAIAVIETDLGEIPAAIQAYQSAASLAPDQIFPWNSVGKLNCMLDRYEDALAAFQEALEHNPKDADSWNGLGDVYHKLERNEDAIAAYQLGNVYEIEGTYDEDPLQVFEKTMQTKLESPQIWDETGNIFFEAGAYEEAISSYRRAIELDPANSFSFQADLTRAEQAKEQFRQQEIEKAKNKNQEHSDPKTHTESAPEPAVLAPIQVSPAPEEKPAARTVVPTTQSGHTDENVTQHGNDLPATIIERTPEAPYWLFDAGPALENAFQPAANYGSTTTKSALSDVKALSAFSMQPSGHPTLQSGRALSSSGSPDPLLVQLPPRTANPASLVDTRPNVIVKDKQEVVSPENDTTYPNTSSPAEDSSLADTQPHMANQNRQILDQSSIDASVVENDISAYRRVTELNPRNDRAWDALGNMYEAIGMHSQAITAFEQAIALGPDKEAYYFHLGIALGYQTHYEMAIEVLKKVLALNPDYLLAHCALAANYRRLGKDAEAQVHIAIARPSMESEGEYNRACFESISGNTDQAIKFLKVALKNQLVQPAMARSDPDLDFIRSDERFEALLH